LLMSATACSTCCSHRRCETALQIFDQPVAISLLQMHERGVTAVSGCVVSKKYIFASFNHQQL
jgi:hypothetical protein